MLLSWGESWFKTHTTTAVMLARCLPGPNNALTHTHKCTCARAHTQPPQLGDPGSKSKELSVTGNHWRFAIYTGCNSLCTLVWVCVCVCGHGQKEVGLRQSHVWPAWSLTQRSKQEPHLLQISFVTETKVKNSPFQMYNLLTLTFAFL